MLMVRGWRWLIALNCSRHALEQLTHSLHQNFGANETDDAFIAWAEHFGATDADAT